VQNSSTPPLFKDRRDAGRQLARRLSRYRDDDVIVLALPRGGVPVAYEVADALHKPLDVIVARKVGAPMQPELGVGAVAPGGILLLDQQSVSMLGLTDADLAPVIQQEREEMRRRLHHYRGDGLPEVKGRTVILVDDGLATGVTATAALHAVRRLDPKQIVLAVPVCAQQTATMLADEVEEVVCVSTPDEFRAVGIWYENFSQTTDAEVMELLDTARQHTSQPG
jgi:putative phosphoribosyl transferase